MNQLHYYCEQTGRLNETVGDYKMTTGVEAFSFPTETDDLPLYGTVTRGTICLATCNTSPLFRDVKLAKTRLHGIWLMYYSPLIEYSSPINISLE